MKVFNDAFSSTENKTVHPPILKRAIGTNLHNSITTVVFLSLMFIFVYCQLNNEQAVRELFLRIKAILYIDQLLQFEQ